MDKENDVIKDNQSSKYKEFLKKWVDNLAEETKTYKKKEGGVENGSLIIGFLFAVIIFILVLSADSESIWVPIIGGVVFGVIIGLIAHAILKSILIKPLLQVRDQHIIAIKDEIERNNYDSADFVRHVAKGVESHSYRDTIMESIDKDEATFLITHEKTLQVLGSFDQLLQGQVDVFFKVDQVASLVEYAYKYAENGYYAEAIALLIVSQLLYQYLGIMAPRVQWTINNMRYTADATWISFDFRSEIDQLSQVVAQKKITPDLLNILQSIKGGAIESNLLEVKDQVRLEVRDQELVDKCTLIASLYSIIVTSKKGLDTLLALSYLPGKPTSLIATTNQFFKFNPFVPQIIDACLRRSSEMESTLLELLKGETVNERFNAAIALGIMHAAEAIEIAKTSLLDSQEPLDKIGAMFILAQAGETAYQKGIIKFLDTSDETISHAAAIALEHLPDPVPNDALEKYLKSGQMLVQLRLTRHIKTHSQVSPGVCEAVKGLLTHKEKAVADQAAETLLVLLSQEELLTLGANIVNSEKDLDLQKRAMMFISHSGSEHAVDYLMNEYKSKGDQAFKNGILEYFGNTKSVKALPVLMDALNDDNSWVVALGPVIQIASVDMPAVLSAAKNLKNKVISSFLLAFLAHDDSAMLDFKKELSTFSIEKRVQALQLATFLASPELTETLKTLRSQSIGNKVQSPINRHLADKALFTILAKSS